MRLVPDVVDGRAAVGQRGVEALDLLGHHDVLAAQHVDGVDLPGAAPDDVLVEAAGLLDLVDVGLERSADLGGGGLHAGDPRVAVSGGSGHRRFEVDGGRLQPLSPHLDPPQRRIHVSHLRIVAPLGPGANGSDDPTPPAQRP